VYIARKCTLNYPITWKEQIGLAPTTFSPVTDILILEDPDPGYEVGSPIQLSTPQQDWK
jgi:hypothetical protein